MGENYDRWLHKQKSPVFQNHLHEFLNVSARYLDVATDSLNMDELAWHETEKEIVTQSNQEVGYATNYV